MKNERQSAHHGNNNKLHEYMNHLLGSNCQLKTHQIEKQQIHEIPASASYNTNTHTLSNF